MTATAKSQHRLWLKARAAPLCRHWRRRQSWHGGPSAVWGSRQDGRARRRLELAGSREASQGLARRAGGPSRRWTMRENVTSGLSPAKSKKIVTIRYNTIQYNTIQYNTIQYDTIRYDTMQCNVIQYNTIQYNTIRYDTIQYNTIQYNTNTTQYNKSLLSLSRK